MLLLKLFFFCVFFAFVLGNDAGPCERKNCKLPNCKCSMSPPNINAKLPQLIALSFDETNFMEDPYFQDIFSRQNPDGCNITGTFFVSHEKTNYSTVNYLYNQQHEVASYSVSKNEDPKYWKQASSNVIRKEMGNQRIIISKFANISAEKIQGARIPQFDLNGDDTYSGLKDAGFLYDNSWITLSEYPLFPYTLDYLSQQPCLKGNCPKMSYPGFWIMPFNNWKGMDGAECDLEHCIIWNSPQIIYDWMLKHFIKNYNGRREPINILLNKAWFMEILNTVEALEMFFNYITPLEDVFIVSNQKVLEWVKNPVPLDKFSSCQHDFKPASCNYNTCEYKNKDGTPLFMGSCVACPDEYPTLDNPEGKKQKQSKKVKKPKKIMKITSLGDKNLHRNEIPSIYESENLKNYRYLDY